MQTDYTTCIKFYVKDSCVDFRKLMAMDDMFDLPWLLASDESGIYFVRWDAKFLGKECPSLVLIESLRDQAETWKAEQAQAAKSIELKTCENNFLLLCEQLTGKKEKVGFDTLRTIIEAMLQTDPNTAIVLSLKLLSIDAEGKRFSATWWNNCVWHPEVIQ